MSDAPKTTNAKLIPLREPEHVPVRVINRLINLDFVGSQFDVLMGTTMLGVTPEGTHEEQMVIAARLRFDIDLARTIHEQLGKAIQAVTTPPKDQVN
ncbi:hypothetical protein MKK63_24055 [Methylobacterium sp. J-088]|uniref:hypothetical protein n=1 Tax=Methylobacterium sp. J-088 TaxID=2836664 RepID=UPI001FB9596B|nr:hypothetical protein [Methylobacterium sp. J-088]MCJ2065753.1 hypothetical protein [Methylobacterium sp. J-088]